MYRLSDGRIVVSPTDLVGYLACDHLTALSREVADGRLSAPVREDAMLAIVTRRGLEHEGRYLAELANSGLDVVDVSPVEIPEETDRSPFEQVRFRQSLTNEAMDSGVECIYQATFLDEGDPAVVWRGHADFLRRVKDGADGRPNYEPDDTKLARHVRPSAVLQLCSYAEQVARIQGTEPEKIHVVLGGNQRVSYRLADFAAYHRAAKSRLVASLQLDAAETYPDPVEHCSICSWSEHCEQRRIDDDHLSLVANLTREQGRKLERVDVGTMSALAACDDDTSVPGIAGSTLTTLRRQARLQVLHREEGPAATLPIEFLTPADEELRGFAKLPLPSAGDIFFDIEGDPFVDDGGIEYLLGIDWVNGGVPNYAAFWAHDREGERRSFESLIDFFIEHRAKHPDAHVYHYANYEPAALLKLACRHATREDEVDGLLTAGAFIDLYRVVRESMAIGAPSYSLKKIEPLYMDVPRHEEVIDAAASIEAYELWLDTQDQSILADIEEYNRVDCASTRLLRDWLEGRRLEYEQSRGASLARPSPRITAPEETENDGLGDELGLLIAALTNGEDEPPQDDQDRARWVLGNLLNWHRREAKSQWRLFFERIQEYGPEDFLGDPECVGGLQYAGAVGTEKRSTLHRYEFDSGQECKLTDGDTVLDASSELKKLDPEVKIPGPGTLVEIHSDEGWLVLKRGNSSTAPHPLDLISGTPINTTVLSNSLVRLAEYVRDHGIDSDGPSRAVRDLLIGSLTRRSGGSEGGHLRLPGESASGAACRLVAELDHGCLAIQGPPGTGKTSTAGEFIAQLVRDGKRVGVIANSHAVISNLLDVTLSVARGAGHSVRTLQVCGVESFRSTDPDVTQAKGAAEVAAALNADTLDLVGGTAWLFAVDLLHDRFDYLVVDEASQLSLANVAAAGGAAQNLVLVGDPQQLAQPSHGVHPPLCGSSALEYLLEGADVVPSDRGVFLDTTHRLHPDICAYVSELSYRDELQTDAECAVQTVAPGPVLGGSGLRWVAVEHQDNKTSSDEEADVVCSLYSALLGRPWTDRDGVHRVLGSDDILVVAPYNAQVAKVRAALRDVSRDARIGTVDKFQGQQAAVVVVSMAASSAEDIPRGMEFLYSRNRLNVAVSRAMALAVVVASPVLLAVHCRSVEQLRLANGLCRLPELALTVA